MSLVVQTVKNPAAMQETWVLFLGWEDPLEKGMAIYSNILPWRIPMDRRACWATVHGVTKSWTRLSDWTVLNTVKGFCVVNKAEVDVFLEMSCFFYDPTDVGNLTSDSSAFSKSRLNIWKFTVHILLKPGSRSLLIDYCIFSILFSRFLIIFITTIHP